MILLVILDLAPVRKHETVQALSRESKEPCFQLRDSVWLLDTVEQPRWWRDRLRERGDVRDRIFITRIHQRWAALQLDGAVEWLTDPARRW